MVLPIILILVIIIIILFHTGYVTLDRTMRELWSDHTWWKKIYIESLISDKKDKDQVLVRLLRNQDGVSFIELALILPILLILVISIIEFG